jgi:phage gp36-like protein
VSEVILDLDQPLMLMALQEASQQLDQLLAELQRPSHSRAECLDLSHRCQVRLTYLLLRCQVPDEDRNAYLALHRHSMRYLADRLRSSVHYQHLVHNR